MKFPMILICFIVLNCHGVILEAKDGTKKPKDELKTEEFKITENRLRVLEEKAKKCITKEYSALKKAVVNSIFEALLPHFIDREEKHLTYPIEIRVKLPHDLYSFYCEHACDGPIEAGIIGKFHQMLGEKNRKFQSSMSEDRKIEIVENGRINGKQRESKKIVTVREENEEEELPIALSLEHVQLPKKAEQEKTANEIAEVGTAIDELFNLGENAYHMYLPREMFHEMVLNQKLYEDRKIIEFDLKKVENRFKAELNLHGLEAENVNARLIGESAVGIQIEVTGKRAKKVYISEKMYNERAIEKLSSEKLDIFQIREISWLFDDNWKWFINSDSEEIFSEYKKLLKEDPNALVQNFEHLTEIVLHIEKGTVSFDCAVSKECENAITADVKVMYPNRTVQKFMHFEKE